MSTPTGADPRHRSTATGPRRAVRAWRPGPRPADPPRPTDPAGRPLAEWWERLLARMLDNVILSSVLVVAEFLGAVPMALDRLARDTARPRSGYCIGGRVLVRGGRHMFRARATYVYEVVLFGGSGQTSASGYMKLAVVSAADGARPDRATRRRRWLAMAARWPSATSSSRCYP